MSTTTLHIGKTRTISFLGSDGSDVPPNTVTAVSAVPSVASVTVAANVATITGLAAGTSGITFAAQGFLSDVEAFNVLPLPTLVPTIGPEV